jgi:hypothetical protein
MGHGRIFSRCVVQSGGVAIATITAATIPAIKVRILVAAASPAPVAQHKTPISIMESPRIFSTSTRRRSVQGDHGYPSANSCKRNSNPSPKISAPRRIVCLAMALRSIPFSRNFSVTSANDTTAKKINSGAGKVPPSRDHAISEDDLFASGLIHES